jgi:hypothetical protein
MPPVADIVQFWDRNSTWMSLVIGLVGGIPITWLFMWLAKKEKQPRFAIRSVKLIEKAKATFPELTIRHKEHEEAIDDLSVVIVAVWNAGTKAIRKEDIPSSDQLRIESAENARILGASIIESNNPASNAVCEYDKETSTVYLGFEFLNYKNGFVLQLLHTGKNSDALTVTGTIIEAIGGHAKRRYSTEPNYFPFTLLRRPRARKRRAYAAFVLTLGMFLTAAGTISAIRDFSEIKPAIRHENRVYTEAPSGYTVHENDDGTITLTPEKNFFAYLAIPATYFASGVYFWLAYCFWRGAGLPRGLDKFENHL